jgi:endonuclease/exonuclease/phosphatase (EEP) superfamily protein YafD
MTSYCSDPASLPRSPPAGSFGRMRARSVLLAVTTILLLGPALVLTTARLIEPDGTLWVQAVAFTPVALVPYALLLGVLLVPLVRRRGRSVPLVLAAVLAVAGLLLHGWWFSPQVLGANPRAASGAEPLTAMTANLTKGEGDGIGLVQAASAARVDVLVVAEITPTVLARMQQAGLDDLFPYRAGRPEEGVSGTMVFARVPLRKPTRLPTVHGSWAVTMGDLRLFAVHPSSPVDVAAWRRDHAAIRAAIGRSRPDLVVGDFNATPDHAPMRALADAGYRSVAELANEGWQPTWPANGGFRVLGVPLPRSAPIDHVVVGERLAAIRSGTVYLAGTDHRALVADVARK